MIKAVKKLILPFALLLFASNVSAQNVCGPNLVPNHDFELNDPVLCGSSINGIGQLWIDTSQVISWMGTSLKNGSGSGITPDHYNNTCTGNSGALCMQGNASVGVFTSTNAGIGPLGTREYVQCELNTPLTAGATYYIQMTVSSGSGSSWAHTDGFGAWLRQDTGPIDIGNNGGVSWIPGTPQFENQTGNIIDDECQIISGYFCADGGENWLMLGNFKEDYQMTVGTTGNNAGSASYVIMDEIFIQEVCPGQNPELMQILADQNPLSCGQSVTIQGSILTTSYGTINYNWLSPGSLVGNPSLGPHTEQLTQNTNYVIEYTAAGACGNFTDTVSLSIDVNSGVNVSLNSLVDETCIGDCDGSIDVGLSGGTAPYATNWYDSGGGLIGSNTNLTNLCSDDYTIEVTTTESIQQTDIIFTEDFESGTAPGWSLNTNPTAGTNGPNNNLWEVSNQSIGSSTGSCNPMTDFTLNLLCPSGCGSDQYDNINTSIMAETPLINTTGYTNLNLTFEFLGEENGSHCNGALYYNDGGGWTYLQDLVSTTCWGPYNGWQPISIALPTALNNNPNAQIGFHWYNDTYIITEDWGLAVNNIQITAETPVNIVCTEIDTFQIAGTTCACIPPSLSTSALNGCSPDSVDMSTGVTTSHLNGAPNVTFYTNQTDADNATNPISNWATVGGTYYVRSEDPLDPNCFITETITVTIGVGPNPGTNNSISLCSTDPAIDLFTQLGGSPDAGGTWSPAMTSGTGVFDPSQDPAGTYTYSVTNACGTLSADVTVTVTNNPDPGTNGSITLCTSDAPIDLFGSLNGTPDTGGSWSPVMTSGTGVFDPNTDPAGTYTYTLNACGGGTLTADVVVTVNPAPNAGTNGTTTLCTTDPSVDLFTLLGGSPDAGGSWSPAMTSGTGVFDPSQDAGGTYTYTVTNSCGSLSADVVVTVNNSPDAGSNGTATFCSTDAPADLFGSLNGTPDIGGTWAPALTSGTGVFDPNVDAAGTYTYTLNACGGGTISADVVVTINPAPVAGTNGSTTLCATDPAVDLFTLLGGSPDAGGSWSPVLTSGTGVFDPSQDAAGTYTYSVTNSCGTANADVSVTITNNPSPGTNGTVTFCPADAPDDLFAFLGGTPDVGGTWSPALVSGTGVFDPSQDPAGTYTYTLNACGGGTLSADVTVSIDPAPNAGTNGNITLCATDPAVDLITVLGGTPDAGGSWSPVMTSGTGVFDPAQDADGTYTYTVTNPCGTAVSTASVTITTNPSPGTNGTISLCTTDSPVDLFNSLGGTPDLGGNWTPALTSGSGTFDPMVDPAGTYTYTLVDCNNNNLTATVDVTINQAPQAGGNSTLDLCFGDAAVDLFTTLGGTPDAGGTWSPTLTSGSTFDPSSDPSGTYTYTVTNGCGTASADVVVNVSDCNPPVSNFEMSSNAICLGDCITLTDLSTGNPTTWEWDFGGASSPNTSSDQNPTICPDSVGTFTIRLTVTNINGSDTYTSDLVVAAIPSVNAGQDTTIDMNASLTLTAVGTPAGGTFEWSDPDLDCPNCSSIQVSPAFTTNYSVVYTTAEGCVATDDVIVTVLFEDVIGVPNGFSPNADGMNDVLFVEGEGITNMTFVIYNRYGNKVFESTDQEVGWDGSFNGYAENPGVFAWYLSYVLIDGTTGTKSGNVTLLK